MADEDRVEGAAPNMGGKVKEAAGNVTGDAKLKHEVEANQVAANAQNAVGRSNDAVRDALKKD